MRDGKIPEWRIALRPVGKADTALLLKVFASTREGERQFVDWDDERWDSFIRVQFEAQCRYYSMQFPGSEHSVVLWGGDPAGRIWVYRDDWEIRLLDVSILPAHQRCGIGTHLIRRLQSEARAAGLPLHHSVEVANEGARRLYERLGFAPLEMRGIHILMEWVAAPVDGSDSS